MRGRRPRKQRRKRRRRRGPAARGPASRSRLWRWLGVGAVGLAGAALLRRTPVGRTPVGRTPVGRTPGTGTADRAAADRAPEEAADPCALPADVEVSWVPGPAGSLRLAERRPTGGDGRERIEILFVHGLGGALEHWAPLLRSLGPALRGVAVDLPGHGRSDPAGDGDYGVGALAAAVGAAVDGLDLRRPVLVAHSLGALAAIDYAGRRPGRVAGLLLVDPGGDQTRMPEDDRRAMRRLLARDPRAETEWNFRHFLADARPPVADRVMESLAATADEVLRGALEGSLSYSPLSALRRFTGPVRILVSELNRSPHGLHNLRSDLPVRRLGRASHWLMMDRPDEVWAELVELLDDLRREVN